jgi:hypothetical protein
MVDPAGGYQNSYWSGSSIKPQSNASSSDNTANSSSKGQELGGPLGFLLHGDPDKRAPDEKPENKEGMLGGFFSGFLNGLKDSVQSLFSWKGLLMMGAIAGLAVATGGAIVPFLVALGGGVGLYQMGTGLLKGDWEEMGRGAFTLGSTALGAKVDFKSVSQLGTGNKFAMAVSSAEKNGVAAAQGKTPGIFDNFRMLAGKKLPNANGNGSKSIYELLGSNAKYRYNQTRGNGLNTTG